MLLEIPRTEGCETGERFRTTDNLQRSSDIRHLWIAEEINCRLKFETLGRGKKANEIGKTLKKEIICYQKEIWTSSEHFKWLTWRQSFGTEATPSIWFGTSWERNREFPRSHNDWTEVADCVTPFPLGVQKSVQKATKRRRVYIYIYTISHHKFKFHQILINNNNNNNNK